MFSGKRVIIPNKLNCLVWKLAVAPADPAINRMKHSGVFWCSFWKFWRQFFWCKWIMLTSARVRWRAATPDSKTGRA